MIDLRCALVLVLAPPVAAQCSYELLSPGVQQAWSEFGRATAVSGDWAFVGSPRRDGPLVDSGAVFVFQRRAAGWVEGQQLFPNNPTVVNYFGAAVAIEGDRAVIGAPRPGDGGSAFVFERQGSAWVEIARLGASDATGQFGSTVALAGDRILVGAPASNDGPLAGAGAVYVFEAQGGSWVEVQKLVSPTSEAGGEFGYSVDAEGDDAVVGAPMEDLLGVNRAGRAYVFTHDGAAYQLDAELTEAVPQVSDLFGTALGISEGTIAIGSPNPSSGFDGGSLSVFGRVLGTWRQTSTLATGRHVGSTVAIHGDRIVSDTGPFQVPHFFEHGLLGWVDQGLLAGGYDNPWSIALSAETALTGRINAVASSISGVRFIEVSEPLGTPYCSPAPNSTGAPGRLSVSGCRCVQLDDFTLHAEGLPLGQFGYFLTSRTQGSSPLGGASQGRLCLGLPLLRFDDDLLSSGSTGSVQFSPHLFLFPENTFLQPGDTWNFQFWVRDTNPNATSNTTEGVCVTWATFGDPSVQFPVTLMDSGEQASALEVLVLLSQPSSVEVRVPFVVTGTATANIDYRIETASPLVIPPDAQFGVLRVIVAADTEVEGDEHVTIRLEAPVGAVLGSAAEFTLTILDDD
ncbi:MAG: hypothetical protein GY711_24800 [bacterium]|nr:hypothetical protein [bacterium]